MKRKALRFAVILLLSLLVFLPLFINAEAASNSKYNTAMVVKLAKFLTTESSEFSKDFDINSDGKVNAIDLTLLKRYLIYGTSPYINEETTTTSTTTTAKTTTTTTKPTTTTTTRATTTTTTTKKTTTTTTSTTKATTTSTTKKTTTTTTTKATTTTTTKTTTTTTTTTSTTTTTNNSDQRTDELISSAIQNISIKDTSVPKYNGDLYEVKDAIFLFKRKNSTYAYTLLSDEPTTATALIQEIPKIKGVHVWLYSGKEKAVSIWESLPDTEDLTFHCIDPTTSETEFEYELEEYSEIFYNEIPFVADRIANNKPIYSFDIGTYDYNLTGTLDIGDVEIMIRYLTSELHNLLWKLNYDALNRYTKEIYQFDNHTNVVLLRTDSTKAVPYAFCIPTADLTDTSVKTVQVPVQIIPASASNLLSKYSEDPTYSDSTASYLAWNYITQKWYKIDPPSDIWKFQAGYYVYVLDDNGNIRQNLVD